MWWKLSQKKTVLLYLLPELQNQVLILNLHTQKINYQLLLTDKSFGTKCTPSWCIIQTITSNNFFDFVRNLGYCNESYCKCDIQCKDNIFQKRIITWMLQLVESFLHSYIKLSTFIKLIKHINYEIPHPAIDTKLQVCLCR